MDLSNLSMDELVGEINRRSKVKQITPKPKDEIDWNPVIQFCEKWNEEITNPDYCDDQDSDNRHWLYELVFEVLYSRSYWEWKSKIR